MSSIANLLELERHVKETDVICTNSAHSVEICTGFIGYFPITPFSLASAPDTKHEQGLLGGGVGCLEVRTIDPALQHNISTVNLMTKAAQAFLDHSKGQ